MELRPYQRDARNEVVRLYQAGVKRQLVVIPTGGGKTRLFAALPEALGFTRYDVVLMCAHVDELLEQGAKAFTDLGLSVQKEKAEKTADVHARIVVGSVQSLRGTRRTEFFERFEGRVRMLIIDEAHRSASKTYRDLIEAFFAQCPDGLLLGVTATPTRSDRIGLGSLYERVAYSMDIEDAIDEGYLVPVQAFQAKTGTDLTKVRTRGGDFDPVVLARAVNTPDRTAAIIEAYARIVGNRKSIVFGASIDHAKALAQGLTDAGYPALPVWGDMPDRERHYALEAFRDGMVQGLTCKDLLIEGVDVPGVEAVVLGRPTKSPVVFRQSIGRGLRPLGELAGILGTLASDQERRDLIAASAKPSLVVLDVADVTGKLSLIGVPSLFGLPAKLDLGGRDPRRIKKLFDKAMEVDPVAAAAATTVAQLEGLAHVDLFTVPRMTTEIANETKMQWLADGEGAWVLSLPPQSSACTYDGEVIADYDARLRDMVRVNTRAGIADPTGQALADLNVDLSSVRREAVSVRVAIDKNDDQQRYAVTLYSATGKRIVLRRRRRAQAFASAEEWLIDAYPATRTYMRGSSAQTAPPSAGQRQELLEKFQVPTERLPLTRADAAALIFKLKQLAESA